MGAINQQQNTKEGEISSLVPLNAIQSCTPGVIQDTNKSVEMMHQSMSSVENQKEYTKSIDYSSKKEMSIDEPIP